MAYQRITGFHQDLENHWVADLQCGHSQHMRHNPPWQNRLWIQSSAGRERQVGQIVNCPRCDVKGAWLQRDIHDKNDITLLVRSFYEKAIPDPIIGFYFTVISEIPTIEHHVTKVASFWDKMLFNKAGYDGKPFYIHRLLHNKVPLTEHHFYHWLSLFTGTVNNLFEGPNTNKICRLAHAIAATMQNALQESKTAVAVKKLSVSAIEFWSSENDPSFFPGG